MPALRLVVLSFALATGDATASAAQAAGTESTAVLARARRAQARFELFRRNHVPPGGGSGGHCDATVGRYCYWNDDVEELPAEPERIREARKALLVELASLAARLPGDGWITGQRVRYAIEGADSAAARAAVADCRADPPWCAALDGTVRHAVGDDAGADTAFDRALGGMPADERCRWRDVSLLLDDPLADRYRKLPCAEREPFERRFWWLARPLLGRAGNDIRSEHFARVVMIRLAAQSRTPRADPWGDDIAEIVLRYGWPVGWARQDRPVPSPAAESIITGYDPVPSFAFLPNAGRFDNPFGSRPDDWADVRRPHDARHRYAPHDITSFDTVAFQLALFRRGDSLLAAVAFRAPWQAESGAAAAVVASPGDSMPMRRAAGSAAAGEARLALSFAATPQLVSLEMVDPVHRRVARTRLGVPVPQAAAFALSDLLLYAPDRVPAPIPQLDSVLARATPGRSVRRRSPLGLYWECYGTTVVRRPVAVSVTTTRLDRTLGERIAGLVGRAVLPAATTLHFGANPGEGAPRTAQAITLDLSGLRPGRYRLDLTVTASDGARATSGRTIDVTDQTA